MRIQLAKFSALLMSVLVFSVYSELHLLASDSEPDAKHESVLVSSVSEEFRGGVHEQYLSYLTDKLHMQLKIVPLPFNRRIQSLRKGEIDLMTGLRSNYEAREDFVFLQPSYVSSANGYFILAKNHTRLKSADDLKLLTVAITEHEKSYLDNVAHIEFNAVTVASLQQKIEMLLRGRIDAFEHVERSALLQLQKMGLSDEIILAEYKPTNMNHFHFALSTRSELMAKKAEMEAVIAQGVANGDFTAIRDGYYQDQLQSE